MKKYTSFLVESNTDDDFVNDYNKLSKIISDFEHNFLTGYGEEFSGIMKRSDEEVKNLSNEWLKNNQPKPKVEPKPKVIKTEPLNKKLDKNGKPIVVDNQYVYNNKVRVKVLSLDAENAPEKVKVVNLSKKSNPVGSPYGATPSGLKLYSLPKKSATT